MISVASRLDKQIARDREAIVQLTHDLVAIPTENPPGVSYEETIGLLLSRLDALGFDETRRVGDCVVSFVGRGPRTLYFGGHYDVVPAQRRDQFKPVVRDGMIIGRGTSDMKAGLAAMTYAARALRDCGALNHGRVGLVFVPDEETAGPRGSRQLVERGALGSGAIGMLTPEPTDGIVWNANRGAVSLRITVHGHHAHVGRQYEGVNAFEGMIAIAEALQELKVDVETRRTDYHIEPDIAKHSILLLGGRVEGGTNFNVVPDVCTFSVDRRLNPEEDLATEAQRLRDTITRAAGDRWRVDVEVLQEEPAAASDERSDLGLVLGNAIRAVTTEPAKFELCPGLLETRFYAARGIPAFAYGPGLLTVSHGPDEHVSVDRVLECARIYARTAAELMAAKG